MASEIPQQILLSVEAEAYIEALNTIAIKDIGSPGWAQQHEHIEKLNMQAVLSASTQEEEFVKECVVSLDKVPILIHELIATETWKEKVFPEMVEQKLEPKVLFPVYMVLYHEVTVANLLETILFHRDAVESAEDSALDLLDYCYRKLSTLVAKMLAAEDCSEDDDEISTDTQDQTAAQSLQELVKQKESLDFDISIKAISILRYITDNLSSLSLSVTSRLLNTHDIPIMLVELVKNPPWTKRKKGKLLKYMDGKWQEVSENDRFKLTKNEGQVWLSLYQLLLNPDCQQKYELNQYRKNTILKLRSHLTEMTLDQVPVLGELQRYLEQLSFMEPPPAKQDLILEQVPEIRDNMLKEFEGKWNKLAKVQCNIFFNPSNADIKAQAQRLAATYNFDMLEGLIADPPKCALCGEPASKRCSRCQNEWYCRRECQVQHWKKHKKACGLLTDALEKIKQEEEQTASR